MFETETSENDVFTLPSHLVESVLVTTEPLT